MAEEGEEVEGAVGMALATAAGSHMAGCLSAESEWREQRFAGGLLVRMLFTTWELETSMPRNDRRSQLLFLRREFQVTQSLPCFRSVASNSRRDEETSHHSDQARWVFSHTLSLRWL